MDFTIKRGKVGILLLHRLCGTPVEMRFVANGLADQGYTVHCPMLAGHCGTEEALRASSWTDWYGSADQALDDIKKDCDFVIAGGLSAGAVLAVMLQKPRQGERDSVACADTLAQRLDDAAVCAAIQTHPLQVVRELFTFRHHDPHGIKDERIREFIQRARTSRGASEAGRPVTPDGAVFEHRHLVKAMQKLVPYVRQPALILHPLEDDYAALKNATRLRDSLKGPIEMMVLEDCYHVMTRRSAAPPRRRGDRRIRRKSHRKPRRRRC